MRRALAAVATLVTAGMGASVWNVPAGQARPSFARDIAPIVYAHCAACHHPDGGAPFALLSYDDVRSRAAAVVRVTTTRMMPPWSAAQSRGYPELLGERSLSARQISMFTAWVGAGMPAGDLSRVPLPPAFPARWPLGIPDLTLTLPRTFSLPADPSDRFFNVVLYLNFPEDRWIRAIDYEPTATTIVRQARFFSAPSSLVIGDEDPLPGFAGLLGPAASKNPGEELAMAIKSLEPLGVWTPGSLPAPVAGGAALLLRRNSNLVLQVQVRGTDTGAIEDGRVAIYFAQTKPASVLTHLSLPPGLGIDANIDIPPGEQRFSVRSELTLQNDVVAFGARGHAHALGRELRLTATLPNGTTRGLLLIDRWVPAVQDTYYFESPIRLPKGTVLRSEIIYDNSPSNPRIQGGPTRVVWGPRPSDEVAGIDLLIELKR